MLNKLKNTIRTLLLPLAARIPLSPNSLTLLGLLVSLISAFLFAKGNLFLAAFLLLLGGVFDTLDGAVARAKGLSSSFGAFFDSVCDRYADGIIFAGIAYAYAVGNIQSDPIFHVPVYFWVIIVMISSYLVSYTRARAEAMGASSMNIGIAERPERMLIIAIGTFAGGLEYAILILVVLTHITFIQRILHAKKSLP